jgi:hypothetical protein
LTKSLCNPLYFGLCESLKEKKEREKKKLKLLEERRNIEKMKNISIVN